VRLEKNSVRTERMSWEGGAGGVCSIKPAAGLANGNGDGGTGDRCARVYACSVCGGTEAIRACRTAVSGTSFLSALSSATKPGEGVSMGPAGGNISDSVGDGSLFSFN